MAEKSGFQSSLFAGMNLGRGNSGISGKPSGDSQNESKGQLKASSVSSKESVESKTKAPVSNFSFITKSKGLQKGEKDDQSSSDNDSSVINLFDTLNEVDSSTGDNQLSLSYSDQLAEILPGIIPLDQGLLPCNSGEGIDSNSSEDLPEYNIDNNVKDVERTGAHDENVHPIKFTLDFPKDTDSCSEMDEKVDPVGLTSDFPENTDSSSEMDEKVDPVKLTSDFSEDMDNSGEVDNTEVLDKDECDIGVKDSDMVKYNLDLDPEESLTLFHSQHTFKLTKLREERQELQTNICTVYKDIKSKMLSMQGQLNNLRTKFDEALTNDDYDLAAEINEQIEELSTEKIQLGSLRSRFLNEKVKEFFSSFVALKSREMEFHKRALGKYEELQKQQGELLGKHKQQCSNEMESRKQELAHEKDQISRSLQHLQLDREHLGKDRKDLDDRINSKLEPFQIRKKELSLKQDELEAEVEQLQKRLKELHSEKKKVECFIKDEDDKMMAVRKEFESLENKLNDGLSEVKYEEEKLSKKLKDISTKENKLDLIIAQEQQKEECLVKNMCYLATSKEESEMFIKTAQAEDDENTSKIILTCLPQDHCDDLMKLRSLEKAKAKDLQDCELKVFHKEQVLSTKTKRLEEIQNQIPQLERTKKCAVTEHNFKEAKRVNEIMKQLADEIETLTKDLDEMQRTLTEDKQKTELLKQDYSSAKSNVVQAKDDYDLTAVKEIVNKVKKIFEMDTSINHDDLLETFKKEEIDLLKIEFSLLEDIRESVLSKLSENDRERLHFLKEVIEEVKDIPASD